MRKAVGLFNVPDGGRFSVNAVEFVKLGHPCNSVLALALDILPERHVFHKDGVSNSFEGSEVQMAIDAWLSDAPERLRNAARKHPLDLTSLDGLTDYGAPEVTGRLLTLNEYRKYRRYIPQAEIPVWMATPWSTYSSLSKYRHDICCINPDGNIYFARADYHTLGVRPALYLDPFLMVSVEEEPETEECISVDDAEERKLIREFLRWRNDIYGKGGHNDVSC